MKWLILLTFLFCAQLCFCQSIKGVVTSQTDNAPIPYATVILKNIDGEFLEGTTTDEKGTYKLKYKTGNYQLVVNFIGCKELVKPIQLKGNIKLNLVLETLSTTLDEITVVEERTTVEQLIDKKVVNVGKDLMSSGGDASTVLEQLSEVQLDQNGNVSLRGSQNVNILVNGKPSPMSNSELLMEIPTEEIKQVEVITSPSAKYQANGLTGIINIITHKKIQKGMNLSTSLNVNTLGGYSGRLSFKYGYSNLGFRLGTNYRKNVFKNENTQTRIGVTPYHQETDFKFGGDILTLNGGIDWFPTDADEFSVSIKYTDNGHTLTNISSIFQNTANLFQNTIGVHSHKTFNVNGNYRHYFNERKDFLELDVQISDNINILESDFQPNLTILDNITDNDVLISNIALDYSAKMSETFKLEAGLLWNEFQLNNTRNFFDDTQNAIVEEDFENTQSTFALFSVGHFKMKKLSLQIGLRAELFNRTANLKSEEEEVKNDFKNLFPSFHASYDLGGGQKFIFGYNRRTSRPSLQQVNPIVYQMNEFSRHQGNPFLNPEFSNNFDISYVVKKEKFTITPAFSYRLKENIITENYFIDGEGVNVFTPVNNGKSNAINTSLSINLRSLKWMTNNLSLNWEYEKLQEDLVGFTRDTHRKFNFIFKNQFKISKKTNLELTWHYTAPYESFYYTNELNQKVDIAFRQKIFNGKGTINLRVPDIFNTQRWEGVSSGTGFAQDFLYNPQLRVGHFSFTYKINGGKLKKRNKKSRRYGSGMID